MELFDYDYVISGAKKLTNYCIAELKEDKLSHINPAAWSRVCKTEINAKSSCRLSRRISGEMSEWRSMETLQGGTLERDLQMLHSEPNLPVMHYNREQPIMTKTVK